MKRTTLLRHLRRQGCTLLREGRRHSIWQTLRHQDASRKNIPTAEYQAVMPEDGRNLIEVAYERRNPGRDSLVSDVSAGSADGAAFEEIFASRNTCS